MNNSVKRLLTEHLPEPPPDLAEPPLAAIRRRARRRTGAQVALVVAAVAVIGAGTAVVMNDAGTASTPAVGGSSTADSPSSANSPSPPVTVPLDMPYPHYLPPGYVLMGEENTELRFVNPDGNPPIPLVIRRLAATARIPAEGPALQQATVRGQTGEVLPVERGGMTLTWLENGKRYSVTLEAPPNSQIDFAPRETVELLVAVADSLRPRR
jgi:hypothetical protein